MNYLASYVNMDQLEEYYEYAKLEAVKKRLNNNEDVCIEDYFK